MAKEAQLAFLLWRQNVEPRRKRRLLLAPQLRGGGRALPPGSNGGDRDRRPARVWLKLRLRNIDRRHGSGPAQAVGMGPLGSPLHPVALIRRRQIRILLVVTHRRLDTPHPQPSIAAQGDEPSGRVPAIAPLDASHMEVIDGVFPVEAPRSDASVRVVLPGARRAQAVRHMALVGGARASGSCP
eukprot:scaffold4916_cov28-Tisochrysis_lutea.AAC.7